jgi:hypothetical protein
MSDRTKLLLTASLVAIATVFLIVAAPDVLFRWSRFLINTLVLFGILLKVYWHDRFSRRLWLLLLAFMISHGILMWHAFYSLHISTISVGIIGFVELSIFAAIAYYMLGVRPQLSNRRGNR